MRLLLFLPDEPAIRGEIDRLLRARPGIRRIEGSDVEAGISAADPKHGFVLIDPPRTVEGLKKIDEICRRVGKGRLPRAVFYAPPGKKQDPAWRESVKEAYHHFHKARRSVAFVKPTPKAFGKAFKIAAKSESLLRWGLLGPMAAAVLVLALGLFVFRDAILKRAAVEGLQAAFGAKTEVDLLASTLAPALMLGDVAVANRREPMTNLFQFDTMKAEVNAGPLFSGRLHVEEMALEGLRFGGARSESGTLPGAEAPPLPVETESAGPTFEEALEALLKRLEPPALDDLRTVRLARELEKEARDRMARYDGATGTLKPPASVEEAVKELSALRPDAALLDKARGDLAAAHGPDFTAETKAIETARADIEGVKKDLDEAKATVEKAKEIKKATFLDAPKIARLLKDLARAQKALEGAPAKLQQARTTLETSKQEAVRKQEEAAQRLQSVDGSIVEARKAAESGADVSRLAPKLAQAKSDLETYRGSLEGLLKGVEDDLESMKKAPGSLQEAVEADRKDLEARYNLDPFTAEELVRALLGEEAAKYVRWTFMAHSALKPWLSRPREPKPVKTPAERGAIYTFPVPEEVPDPRVWIKKAVFKGPISIQGEAGTLEGSATHLSTDPARVGEEARLELRAVAGPRTFALTLTISPSGALTAEIAAEGFGLRGGSLKNRYLTADLGSGSAGVKVSLKLGENGLRADGSASFTRLKMEPAPGGDPKMAFIGDLLKGIDRLDVQFEAEGTEQGLAAFRVRSDQTSDLTDKLRGAVTGRVEEAKQKALAGLDAQVAGPRKQAEAALMGFMAAIPGKGDGGADPLARVNALEKILSGAGGSEELTASLRTELDALTAQSAANKEKNAAASTAQAAAADGALQALATQQESLGAVQAALDEQIDRLKKLK